MRIVTHRFDKYAGYLSMYLSTVSHFPPIHYIAFVQSFVYRAASLAEALHNAFASSLVLSLASFLFRLS